MWKKKPSKGSQVNNSWLLPYADMLTLLLALFIILFAMSEIDAQKYKELANIFKTEFSNNKIGFETNKNASIVTENTENEDREDDENDNQLNDLLQMQKKIDQYIEDHNLTDDLGTKLSGEGLLVTISTDISFDSGNAHVKEKGRKIAQEISHLLETDPPHNIIVSGHADDRPIHNEEFQSNWDLSVMRAVNFMSLLLDNGKLDPEKFSSKGFGEYQPIAPNTSEENRAKNRRVEVLIQPHDEQEV